MTISKKCSVALLSLAILLGVSANGSAHSKAARRVPQTRIENVQHTSKLNINRNVEPTMGNKAALAKQSKAQNRSLEVPQTYKAIHHHNHAKNWFVDGLDKRNLRARGWVSWHESRDNWKVLSYGHRCIGYFQLDPRYLGTKHGHINLNKKHQVRVADAYAKSRYGDWVHAKGFWKIHHWY